MTSLPRHCGDGVEVCAQLTVFSVGGERLSDNLADVGFCRLLRVGVRQGY